MSRLPSQKRAGVSTGPITRNDSSPVKFNVRVQRQRFNVQRSTFRKCAAAEIVLSSFIVYVVFFR